MPRGSHRPRTRPPLARAIASVIAAGALALLGASAAQASTPNAHDTSGMGSVSAVGTSTVGTTARSSVDDFSFTSFDADYRLGRDHEDHATLTTTETLVAQFPQSDQNHGIRRAIPTMLDGHPTDVHIVSVTDGSGQPRSYSTDDDDDMLVLTIAAKTFVHGTQTYVITYTEKNVIHFPDDANDEEFYRDINGTGWAQQFGSVTGRLHVPASLASHLTGQTACFQGVYGATDQCSRLETTSSGPTQVVTARGLNLSPHANVTMVVGFTEGTFTPRDSSFFATWVAFPMIGATLLALIALITAIVSRATVWGNAPGRPTIIAEYLPPSDLDLLMAGRIMKSPRRRSIVAGILDLAVRGIVRVVEREAMPHRKKRFSLKLSQATDLASVDRSLAHAIFGGIKRGIRLDLGTRSTELGGRISKLLAAVPARAKTDGYERSTKGRRRNILVIVGLIAAIGGLVPAIAMVSLSYGGPWPLLMALAGIILGVGSVIVASSGRPLTDRGAQTRDHLAGLKLYIELAEADRMRVLQSPTGALRASTPISDEEVLRLNERLLPYAVLFKRDKEWMRVLGDAYEAAGTSPSWYSGSGAFNAAILASSISTISTASASWAGSATNSSGSGFGGGGFSGGGGGGGV